MEKKQGNTKECPDDGLTIHFYIITFLTTLLSCTWFIWNYEARQFLYRKMATACVCSRFKRRFISRSVEIRPGTTIAHQRENRCNRKPCQVEYGGKSQNIKEFKSTIPYGSRFGKINSFSQSYNDDQKFDKNDLSNIDI